MTMNMEMVHAFLLVMVKQLDAFLTILKLAWLELMYLYLFLLLIIALGVGSAHYLVIYTPAVQTLLVSTQSEKQ